ncbi:MAG: integrase/recombinase XerD, partial [Gaiellales bacterium]|nr:integrase/recombinase XerD [Gaiellales bacterium]
MGDFADTSASASVDVELLPAAAARVSPALPAGEQLLDANLYAVCELVAGRAARASSARQYGAIYTRFCDALRDELGRPPVVGDVTADAIAAYSRALERHGGRGGGPASPATRRVHLTMLRALLTQLGRDGEAADVRVPSHRAGPPETFSAVQYGNLLRAPDRRTLIGKRDHALLRLMGDCGLRNAELRALTVRAIRRPRANSAHHHVFVRGKGDVEREIPIPAATFAALEAWLRAHPQRDGGGLRDQDVIFVRLARDGTRGAISQQALAKLLRRHAANAGVPERLAHPHALRGYYAT